MKTRIDKVYRQIANHLKRTPLVKSDSINEITGCRVLLKMENEQITGSFKFRGALSKFTELAESETELNQVVAASTGNHALAVCHAAKTYNCVPIIFVPETISKSKLSKLEANKAQIYIEGAQSGETELIAINWAKSHDLPLIHPYNDPAVIAGQGTIGLELTKQTKQLDQVFVPVGGGGLISGIASYLKEACPLVRIVGVQPKNASEMAESIEKGTIVPPSTVHTISEGTAGGLDPATVTYDYCKHLVDEFILVEEEEIVDALRLMEHHLGVKVEPSAGLALAGIIRSRNKVAGQTCAAIVCGGNIDEADYRRLLSEFGY